MYLTVYQQTKQTIANCTIMSHHYRGRMSLGGRSTTPLRDSSAYHNSFRGTPSTADYRTETPSKDRRALLEEWRQTRSTTAGMTESASKRPRFQDHHLPPASSLSGNTSAPSSMTTVNMHFPEGSTALERFRMRKLMQHQQQSSGEADLNNSFTSSICYDDSDEVTSIFSGNAASRPGRMAPTPSSMALLPLPCIVCVFLDPV